MTSQEAIVALRAADPERRYSLFATKETRDYRHIEGQQPPPSYTISIVPGLKGPECDQWASESFEESVALALAALNPPKPATTENDE